MKRDKNLQHLSRDHHHGLLLGWKIRQGLKHLIEPGLIAEYISYFSTAALFPHFEEEEKHILTYLPDVDSLKQRTLREHRNIGRLINYLASSDKIDPIVLLKLAAYLEEHIRFEERELFPYLEKQLDSSQLESIGNAIALTHKPFIDKFHKEFWKKDVDQC